MKNFLFFSGIIAIFTACGASPNRNDPAPWAKIHLNFREIDANGLKNGVAVNYEFCVPAEEKFYKTVQKIDPTLQLMKGSKGRVGCSEKEWLLVGSTKQKNYRTVLYDLAALPYITRIEETFWE